MDNETLTILQEQLLKLPKSVVAFLATPNWNEDLDAIASMYNLDEEQVSNFKREVALVLAGLVPVDEFGSALQEELGLKGAVLEAVVNATEQKIFNSIRADLVSFFENETNSSEEQPAPTPETTEKNVPVEPEAPAMFKNVVAPENLPIAPEVEPLIPPIEEKVGNRVYTPEPQQPKIEPHPFEEKMKQVFTSGQADPDSLVLEPVASSTAVAPETSFVPPTINPVQPSTPQAPATPSPATSTAQEVAIPVVPRKDPYREPIE